MTTLNYYLFTEYVRAFAEVHPQVARYGRDFVDQLQNFGSSGTSYPILYCAPSTTQFVPNPFIGSRISRHTFTCYCLDLILDDRANITSILTTTSCVLNDLFKWLAESGLPGIDVRGTSGLRPLNNYTMESCAGWAMTLTVDIDSTGVCEIPFASTPSLITNAPLQPSPEGSTPPPSGFVDDPNFNNWRINYSTTQGFFTNSLPAPQDTIDCLTSFPVIGTPNVNTSFTRGSWWYIIQNSNLHQIRYQGSYQRNFTVTSSISGTTNLPSNIQYGFFYLEGGLGYYTPSLGTGQVTTGGIYHDPVTLTFTWSPRQPLDNIYHVWWFCGEPYQGWYRGAINTTIQQVGNAIP
jgi:hypothetical protein